VGFVGAAESKNRLMKQKELAYITNIGPKVVVHVQLLL